MSDIVAQKAKRPLSPHLQVYKLPLTALLSISHRITGSALAVGTLLVSAFFFAAAIDESYYTMVMDFAVTPLGKVILFAWSLALFYHMSNGVRHMIWDTTALLGKATAMKTNYFVIASTLLLTFATWFCAYDLWKG